MVIALHIGMVSSLLLSAGTALIIKKHSTNVDGEMLM